MRQLGVVSQLLPPTAPSSPSFRPQVPLNPSTSSLSFEHSFLRRQRPLHPRPRPHRPRSVPPSRGRRREQEFRQDARAGRDSILVVRRRQRGGRVV